MSQLRRIDLFLKEIEDEYVKENFILLQRAIECILLNPIESGQNVGAPTIVVQAPAPAAMPSDSNEGGDVGRVISIATAAHTISALKLVTTDPNSGNITFADPSTDSQSQVMGITLNAASGGNPVQVLTFGELEDSSFTFPIDSDLYLDINGNITTAIPSGNFHVKVGRVLDIGKILINIEEKIQLC